jgi:hypothetical protein
MLGCDPNRIGQLRSGCSPSRRYRPILAGHGTEMSAVKLPLGDPDYGLMSMRRWMIGICVS